MTSHKAPMPRGVSRALDGWLRRRAAIAKQPLRGAILLGAVNGLLLVPEAWLLARSITAVVFQHRGLAAVAPSLAIILGIALLRALLSHGATIAAMAASTRVKTDIRHALHAKIAALGPGFLGTQRSGDLASLLVEGVDALDNYYAAYLPQMAVATFLPVALLAFIFPVDWVSGIILLLGAPLIPIFMILIGRGTERLNQTQWRRLALMSAHFFDVVEGLSTLKLFGASRDAAGLIGRMSEDYRLSTMRVLRVAFLSSLVLEFFTTLGVAMIAVFVGFRLYYGEIQFLAGLFVLLLAPEFFRPLRAMGTQYHARMEAIGASERIVALLETPEPETPAGVAALPAGSGILRFEQVSFSYAPGEPVLEAIQFAIARGERVALVGPSGSGKSTVARLLLGLARPDSGRITQGDIDLASIAPDAWFRESSWMPQRPTLFAGTLAENIRLGAPDASMPEIIRAAEAAEAHLFISCLPHGYETVIGERGQGLSGGEIRRVALARALLKPARLLVLDEAEASLDAETASLIRAAIVRLPRDISVLLIAHRLESAEAADRILVLRQGRIVEEGTPATLRAGTGDYAAMSALYHEGAA
ncbi:MULTISPECIES: thiol reductant ABC exporter subunit CydD [Acetobacter]|uniref:Thiol reductant ABC exporter subunit CydD n=1 Tax=Acetobacter musti TaxID=864732 RepID=A0ABX0JT97_9PROT|nr:MULTISPECIES: thiol reductant ABC exporter subunit CydD [Acetobacter]MBV1838739.1 thiol reductant ABC exporter subunit CydD [Acetobacter estunensis]NHN86716.1 thiol reductant ABC exporter subunit CydD [Acetobacter musti]